MIGRWAAIAMVLGWLIGSAAAAEAVGGAYAFHFDGIDGEAVNLADYKGKTVMVVNTASQCGFTPQYQGLQALWEKYRDRGFVLIGVPSNDFGGQEPGTEAEIKKFCEVNFNVDFPMTAKTVVSGADAHPFYRWARDALGAMAAPKWNFHKYLIGPDGKLADWFSTVTEPGSEKVLRAVEAQLAKG